MKAEIFSLVFLGTVFISDIFASELITVPAGEITAFWQSPISSKRKVESKKNKKKLEEVKKIKISEFKIMKFAVTIKEFNDFIDTHPEWNKLKASSLYTDDNYLEMINNDKNHSEAPITSVSWFAARAYCSSMQMRLPTLLEWEYVAAASEKIKDANRDDKFLSRILEWYGEPRTDFLKNVGTIYKNIYGVWDLHGLIWEWVEDFNTSFVTGESREDSSFNKDMFCGSGGLSGANKENYAAFMRFAFRSSLTGRSSVWNLGFRCVKEIK